jgi:hypothetical protein
MFISDPETTKTLAGGSAALAGAARDVKTNNAVKSTFLKTLIV